MFKNQGSSTKSCGYRNARNIICLQIVYCLACSFFLYKLQNCPVNVTRILIISLEHSAFEKPKSEMKINFILIRFTEFKSLNCINLWSNDRRILFIICMYLGIFVQYIRINVHLCMCISLPCQSEILASMVLSQIVQDKRSLGYWSGRDWNRYDIYDTCITWNLGMILKCLKFCPIHNY